MCAACHSLWDATALNHISGSNDEPGTVTAMIQFEGCTTFGLSSTPGDIPCQGPWPAPLDSCQLLRRPTSTPKASFILTAPTSEKQLGCEGRAQVFTHCQSNIFTEMKGTHWAPRSLRFPWASVVRWGSGTETYPWSFSSWKERNDSRALLRRVKSVRLHSSWERPPRPSSCSTNEGGLKPLSGTQVNSAGQSRASLTRNSCKARAFNMSINCHMWCLSQPFRNSNYSEEIAQTMLRVPPRRALL